MPWELVFLLGGGFALAKGTSESGLSAYLGVQLEALR
jgi:sodium-dependent dicarboxylate transporter 2/3/5